MLNSLTTGKHYKDKIYKWSIEYPDLFRELRNRVEKNKEKKDVTPIDDKIKLLNEYFTHHKELCKQSYIKQGVKLGSFQSTLITALRSGKHYKNKLQEWSAKYPDLFTHLRKRVI